MNFKQEPLHPELALYRSKAGPFDMINHPLVQSLPHHEMLNAQLNAQLAYKQEALLRAESSRDWHSYVFLHERPYRVNALATLAHRLSGTKYWALLGSVWIDSENIWQNQRVWRNLWLGRDPHQYRTKLHTDSFRSRCMEASERKSLRKMPDEITVYRGGRAEHRTAASGYSWTLSLDKAQWFAGRPLLDGETGVVYKRTISKAQALAYFTGRGEEEIVTICDDSPIKVCEVNK